MGLEAGCEYNEKEEEDESTNVQMQLPESDMGVRLYQEWPPAKIRNFQRLLLGWYEKNRRELPWRNRPTPYRVWVSEIMLQQTQVRTVLPYYERFMRRFPDVSALAGSSEEEVLKFWAGLGYYSRARNLHRAARRIVRDYGGRFPNNFEEILLLPGIGRYTAGAIHSIAFNKPQPIVDGNVRRVISRLHGIEKGAPEDFLWEQAAAWVPTDCPSDFNQAIMELGALLCVPAQPVCLLCPVHLLCEARRKGVQDRIPAPRTSRAAAAVELVMLVLGGKAGILMTTERVTTFIPGKWGLPVRTVELEDSPEAVAAKLARRIYGKPLELRECAPVRHGITYRRIFAHVFHAELDRVVFKLTSSSYRWIDLPDLEGFITSSLFRKALHSALGRSSLSSDV